MIKSLIAVGLILIAGGWQEQAQSKAEDQVIDSSASLTQMLRMAEANNPSVKAAYHRWKAAKAKITQARALPDPTVSYAHFIKEVETRVGPQERKVGVSQMLPWPGKLLLKKGAAKIEAESLKRQYEAEKLRLFYQFKSAYYDYTFTGCAINITEQNIGLMKNWEKVLLARYAVAKAAHRNLIKVQIELGKLEDNLQMLEDMAAPIRARMNAFMNRPVGTPIPFPSTAVSASPATALLHDDLQGRMRALNPELQAMAQNVAKAEQVHQLKKRSYLPDFMVGMDYILTGPSRNPGMIGSDEDGKDPIVIMGSMTLPIWFGRNAASVREARQTRKAMKMAKASMENQLSVRLEKVLFKYNDSRRKSDLYGNTLIKKAEESLKATEISFRSADATFLDLIDAQRLYLKLQIKHERARMDNLQSLAEIEMLTGKELKL